MSGAALLAALKQDKFWPIFHAIAERRDTLDHDKLVSIADTLQLDHRSFTGALDAAGAEVALDIADAIRRRIQGAPVLFINDQRVDGLQSDRIYTAILDSQLKSLPATQASMQEWPSCRAYPRQNDAGPQAMWSGICFGAG